MECDFKLARVLRDGKTTKVLARFYVGETSTELEESTDGPVSVTRYRRLEKDRDEEVSFKGSKTDEEIRGELKARLYAYAITESDERRSIVKTIKEQIL